MSRLLAYMANDPQRLRCALHPGRSLLVARATDEGAESIDGWGVGFFQGGEVLLQRRPKTATEIDLYEQVRELRTDALIAHVRHATVGDQRNENTQPFRFRSWLFAHHGTIAGYPEIAGALLSQVPDFLRRNVRGQTDSEHLFHLFLANLHAAGKIDDANLSTQAAAAALAETIDQAARVAGAGSTFDVAAANGRILVVCRLGVPLYYYRIEGLRDCPVCRDAPQEMGGWRAADHEHLRAVVVAGGGATLSPGAPWREMPDRSVLSVTHELKLEIAPLR